MRKSMRLLAILTASVVLFFALLCAFGFEHDCSGEDCLFCTMISGIKVFFGTAVTALFIFSPSGLRLRRSVFSSGVLCRHVSPVTCKTKLSE